MDPRGDEVEMLRAERGRLMGELDLHRRAAAVWMLALVELLRRGRAREARLRGNLAAARRGREVWRGRARAAEAMLAAQARERRRGRSRV